jgi:hypothetical protein
MTPAVQNELYTSGDSLIFYEVGMLPFHFGFEMNGCGEGIN